MTFSNCPLDIADSDCLVRKIGKVIVYHLEQESHAIFDGLVARPTRRLLGAPGQKR